MVPVAFLWTSLRSKFGDGARRPVSRVLSAPPTVSHGDAGRPFLLDAPFSAPRATNPDGGAGMLLRLATRPSLFGLAPGGVCPAAPVARGAVRSCRAVSPLPAGRVAATCTGGLFSVALSLGSPPPDVIRHRIPVEPGLSSAPCGTAAVQPSGNPSLAGNRGTGQASRRAFSTSRCTADSRSRVPASASPVTASGRQ
jgi:hypothetical protein